MNMARQAISRRAGNRQRCPPNLDYLPPSKSSPPSPLIPPILEEELGVSKSKVGVGAGVSWTIAGAGAGVLAVWARRLFVTLLATFLAPFLAADFLAGLAFFAAALLVAPFFAAFFAAFFAPRELFTFLEDRLAAAFPRFLETLDLLLAFFAGIFPPVLLMEIAFCFSAHPTK
jgi:hypothetical protein